MGQQTVTVLGQIENLLDLAIREGYGGSLGKQSLLRFPEAPVWHSA